MTFSKFGIRAKNLGGFLIVLLIALAIGVTGYFSLGKAVKDAEINSLALSTQNTLLQARQQEKNYIMRSDAHAYEQLITHMDDLENTLAVLNRKAGSRQKTETAQISRLRTQYLQAAAEMKRITQQNASIIKTLQSVNTDISDISRKQVQQVTENTHAAIIQANTRTLKDNAIKKITNVVGLGHDVLQIYYRSGLGKPDALDAVRQMHFDGSNYYYVVHENMTLLAHGSRPELEGRDISTVKDKKTGKAYMLDVVRNAVANGSSLTEYYWTKPGMGDAVFPKITYARYFKPWGLIICAGVYVEDIDKKAAEIRTMLKNGFDALQEANAIESQTLKARIDALYYLKYQTHPEKVESALSGVKELTIATDALKNVVDRYTRNFNKMVQNDQQIDHQIDLIQETARSSMDAAGTLAGMAQKGFADSSAFGKMIILIFVVTGFVIGLGLAFLLTQSITRPIQQVIEGLRRSSDEVASASGQVASASQQLAEGASEQAAAIEETSSSLEEMSSMTKTNADNAGQANTIVKASSEDMQQAEHSMTELTGAMDDISQASEETHDIVKTIDEIAFQTNLLALNAAVEAARAGEAGAGFAVVADEVRNLALRAADAAKNTADLIEGTVKKVDNGSRFVKQANMAFMQVKSSAVKVGELVAEITAASHEQANGIEQTAKAVTEMDKVTQQTAANAEESASAASEMSSQAEKMKTIVLELLSVVEGNGGQNAAIPAPIEAVSRSGSNLNATYNSKTPRSRMVSAIPAASATKTVEPESVIPMDNDDDNFKNF